MATLLYSIFVGVMVLIAGACSLVGFVAASASESKSASDITEGHPQ